MKIPSPLPTGISRVMLRSGKRPHAEPRAFYNANVGWRGEQRAKHFSIDKHGEELAFALAHQWRTAQVAKLITSNPHGRFNRAGFRKTANL